MTVSPALRSKLDAVKGFPVSAQESLDIEMARYCLRLEWALEQARSVAKAVTA